MALAGALALALPVGALIAVVPDGQRQLNVTAAGTSPPSALRSTSEGDMAIDVTTTTVTPAGTEPAAPPSTWAATAAAGPQAGRGYAPATTAVTAGPGAGQPVGGSASTPKPADDRAGGGPAVSMPTTTAPVTGPPLQACAVGDVKVTVSTAKATYAPGETVTGVSTLENRSGVACLVSARAFFRIEDTGGRVVSSFAYTADFRMPVKAEPGQTFADRFTWNQLNCTSNPCVQVPGGTYVVVADWNEAGPYSGRGSFSVSP